MKSILNKIEIHPLLVVCIFIFILIGRFKFIIYFMIIILVHELGHITLSLLFKWNISKIIVLPFGGLIVFEEKIDKPLIEEFLIAISGVTFQTLFYLIIKDKVKYEYLSFINYFILIFNLLPIYPLDGSKILNVLINRISTFKNSIKITVFISFIFILLCIFISLKTNLLFIIIFIFLIREIIKLYVEIEYLFNKFLLERYLHKYNFKKKIIIKSVDSLKRNYEHIFFINKEYYNEKDFLNKYFNNV